MSTPFDARWDWLRDREWTCSTCAAVHQGLLHLACACPVHWTGPDEPLPNSALADHPPCLTEDFCRTDGGFFIRCQLALPLIGDPRGEAFTLSVWSSLALENFQIYLDTFDSGDPGSLGPWFGWFSNRLAGFPDTVNLKCRVHPQAGRQRPWLELEPTGHPLAVESRLGVTYERLLEIYAASGHILPPPAP